MVRPMARKPARKPLKTPYANLHLRLAHQDHERVQAWATAEHRSVAQMLSLMIVECLNKRDEADKPASKRAA